MTNDSVDIIHTGPGTLAGRYLRTFWQPVYRAQDLPAGRAAPIRIMGENHTLYRGENGTPHVVAFKCAHRGTQLSLGWVEGDCIRCFYHGWKYEGSGQCVEQPGEEESFAKKIRIRSYPTQEYLGLIFAYFGEGQSPPLPLYPDFEVEGVIEVVPRQDWPCNFFNRLDNAGDPVHVPFVHRMSRKRMNIDEHIRKLTAEETESGMIMTQISPGGEIRKRHFIMPNIVHLRSRVRIETSLDDSVERGGWMNPLLQRLPLEDKQGVRMNRLLWRVPIDDEHCAGLGTGILYLKGDASKAYQESRQQAQGAAEPVDVELGEAVLAGKLRIEDLKVSENYKLISVEDYVAQVGQGSIADHADYHLGRNDVVVILLRKLWERELRALAEGKPLKQWKPPASLSG